MPVAALPKVGDPLLSRSIISFSDSFLEVLPGTLASDDAKNLEEEIMKGLKFVGGRLSPPRVVALVLLLAGCGESITETRTPKSKEFADLQKTKTFLDSEDIVTIMKAPDQVANQAFSKSEQEQREKSLIPLDKFPQNQPALVIDDLSLAGEAQDSKNVTDLRPFDTPIRNQGSRPWCTAFATIGAIENLAKQNFDANLDLSEIHHFQSYGVYQTSPSLNAAKTIGLIDEELWPYYGQRKTGSDSRIRARLTGSKKIQLTLTEVVKAIRSGLPVVINLMVNGSFMNPKTGGIIVPGGFQSGGHAIALTGVVVDGRVDGGGYFIIKNSWGSSWGNKGYGYLPFSYCKYSSCYAWTINEIQVADDQGRLRDKVPGIPPAPAPQPLPDTKPLPVPVTPTPKDDELNEDSFKLVTQLKDYRGLLGAYFYTLTISGTQADLNQVAAVTYSVEGYRDFQTALGDSAANITGSDIMSRSYRIWPAQIDRATAKVRLKNGKDILVRGIDLEF